MNGHHGKDFSVEVFQAIEIGVVHANGPVSPLPEKNRVN